MNQKIKDILGTAAIIALLLFGFAAMRYVNAYSKSIQPTSFRSFNVEGQGKVVVTPDVARFTFSIISEGGKDLAALQRANSDTSKKAIDFLKSKGVEAKDIATQNYNVEPRYENYNCYQIPTANGVRPCPPPTIVGYSITQGVEVKVRDFTKIGDILSGVVGAGANNVSQLAFTIDDPSTLQDKAREIAIKKANAKAQSIAAAGGFSIGKLLSITEGGGGYPIMYDKANFNMTEGMRSAGIAAPTPAIEAGSQDVTVNVSLTYEIE